MLAAALRRVVVPSVHFCALSGTPCPADRGPNSSSLYPPQAAVVAVALFLVSPICCFAADFTPLQNVKVLRKRNTIGGAVNRRSTKNAFSAAASIFVLRHLLRGLKGASSPFLVHPARRNRWCFLVLFWHERKNISLMKMLSAPHSAQAVHKETKPTATAL